MNWRGELIDRLAQRPCCGYGADDGIATEPSALAALALNAEGRIDCCEQVASWLRRIQAPDGSIGVRATESTPCWPTSLAVLVWLKLRDKAGLFASNAFSAVEWILGDRGETLPRQGGLGHDPSLVAWSWVEGTHSWIEPTSLHVVALKAAGFGEHLRTRQAVQMLVNRQLPRGGCNYGNTFVLDRPLRAHVQPTGMALLALASEPDDTRRIRQSLNYLRDNVSEDTSTNSLCWGLIALAAHGMTPRAAGSWLEMAYRRTMQRPYAPLKLALILLALQGRDSWLVQATRRTTPDRTSLTRATPVLEGVFRAGSSEYVESEPSIPRRRD